MDIKTLVETKLYEALGLEENTKPISKERYAEKYGNNVAKAKKDLVAKERMLKTLAKKENPKKLSQTYVNHRKSLRNLKSFIADF